MIFRMFSGKNKKLTLKKQMKAEVISLGQVLKQARSFQSFCDYNEVFDMNRKAIVKRKNNLFQLYAHGIGIDSPHLIFNKN